MAESLAGTKVGPPKDSPSPGGWAPSPPPPRPGPAPGLGYAGFWIRFAAWLIDAVLLAIVLTVLGQYTDIGFQIHTGGSAVVGDRYYDHYYGATVTNPLPVLVAGVYFVVFWSVLGASPGLLLFRMRIRRSETGTEPGLGWALVRYLGMLIAAIPLGLGLMWAGWDWRKQGWHDKMAGTVVVRPAGYR